MRHPETSALATTLLPSSAQDTFDLSPDECDSLRDACGDLLVRIGFDESYEPVPEGVVLESLIDRLLV